jgi:hypothetical protein
MDLVTDDEFPKAIPAHRRATTTVQRQDSDNTLVDPDSQGENRNRNTLKVGSKRSIAAVDSRAEPGPALKKRTSIITPVIRQSLSLSLLEDRKQQCADELFSPTYRFNF